MKYWALEVLKGMVELRAIRDAWRALVTDKVVRARTVYNQIKPENLAPEKLEDPDVRQQIAEKGFYEVAHERQADFIEGLDYLVERGYVEKRKDRIYDIGWYYTAHPYIPLITISGGVGITSKSKSPYESFTLISSQFEVFERTAKEFKAQVDAGKHPHITRFEYGVKLSYETEIYELKDIYFDAIYVRYSETDNRLIVNLVEPFVETRDGRTKKNWTPGERVPEDIFLKGSTEMDPLLEKLEWKKSVAGVVIFQNRAYWKAPSGITPEVEDDAPPRMMPDYLSGDVFSHNNYMSRIFEDTTADYLRQRYSYDAYARIKPDYLEGKEIDVFGRRAGIPQRITVCECKLRFGDSPITMTDITIFHEKILVIKENEGRGVNTIFHYWFVTNAETFEEGVKDYADNVGIDIMKAELSANWEKRAHWKVNNLGKDE